jgi:hypothetical protein
LASAWSVWRVWRYQSGNQNRYIIEEQTTQWPKEKGQKDKQQSTNITHKTKDRVTRTPLKTGGELRCSGRVSSSCSTSDTRRVNHRVISHGRGKDRELIHSDMVQRSEYDKGIFWPNLRNCLYRYHIKHNHWKVRKYFFFYDFTLSFVLCCLAT